MRIRLALLLILMVVFTALMPYQPVMAARGTPGSSEFGYGAHLNLGGTYAIEGVRLASDLQLDWLAIDVSWQSISPKQGAVDWSRIDAAMQAATRSEQPVLISLVEPPDWAQTPQGPDSNQVGLLVVQLAQRYPKTVQAIELFPGANTRAGWGHQPNPQVYFKVVQAVQASLQKAKSSMLLVVGGLIPVQSGTDPIQAVDDLAFLQSLYSSGLKNVANIISVQAAALTGEPLQAPDKSENRVLRHYEEIRNLMLKNKHETGLIWITRLSPPNGQINPADQKYQDAALQTDWLYQAYGQLKSQLYIGVAFLNAINPSSTNAASVSLIEPGGDYHPFYRNLRDLVDINRSDSSHYRPGRPKDQPLPKSNK